MNRYKHILMVGGTGMLRSASVRLGAHSSRLTSVARTDRSLNEVDAALPHECGSHYQLKLDWANPEAFLEEIIDHIERTESPDLVVAWIHNDHLATRLFSLLSEYVPVPRFFHIIGSASANPSDNADSLLADMPQSITGNYHQVILGAKGKGIEARWLTDQEISEGVLEAVGNQRARFVVGNLER